ncbi:hypothetical protein ACROYT_G026531 [Oculina patagonica]
MCESQYFFIASQHNGLVLDISAGKKGGKLVLSEADGGPSQLWRWDEDCRLVSKLDLVADIEGKSKKAGAVCHAWNAHDGLNQKWRFEEGAIKSNLNGLVIDAVTQLVSMQEVNGTLTQMWYFVPENAWPDGRLIIPSVQYFFIVSQDKGLVLDISTGKKGGNLVLSEADGRFSQLWRWDEDCRLVSKLGLVADIQGKKKKAGTVCIAWNTCDGLNQKWRVEDDGIKSNFSNLVIDAVTQPVSMQEVNGTLTQKWYFVTENMRPDGGLVIPSARYFFIVNQDKGLVLDISTGKKGGDLVLSEADGRFSQLWRWDEDCRLVSKLGLVADIQNPTLSTLLYKAAIVIKNSETASPRCHAWNAHDGLDQKWRVEEGAIKSNLNNLVIDAASLPVSMHEVNDTPTQKWYFVPENAWDDFKLVQADPNPLNKAQFWKTLADNHLDVIIGYKIDDYEDKVRKASKIMDGCSSKLDKLAKDTGIVGTVGGSVSIVAGGMAIAGLALAPFTGGVSIGLTMAGVATGAATGVTSLTCSLVNKVWEKSEAKKITKATAPLLRATLSLQGFLDEYINNLKEAAEFLKTPKGEAVAEDAYAIAEATKDTGLAASSTFKIGNTVYKGVQKFRKAKQIKGLVDFIQADYYLVHGAKIGTATQTASPAVSIPILGNTLVAAGTTSAQVISSSMAVFGIAFGIWDIYEGAKKIENGSELAEEFRNSAKDLKAESAKLIKLYKELQEG